MASGESTKEYRSIQRHYARLIDILGKTVDPAHFAMKLREESLIGEDIMAKASVVGVLTGSQRITPVIDAVLAQVKLKANDFHMFMIVLKADNPSLADIISEYYTSSLELHALGVLENVSEWEELGHQLSVDPEELKLLQSGRDPEYYREQVVLEWLKGDGEASWEKLCGALERMGREAEVLTVRDQYASDNVPTTTSGEGGVTDHPCSIESVVAKEVNKFESWFAELVFRLQTEMEEQETSVKMFRNSITLLPHAIRKEHLQFVKDSLDDILNAECIERLFSYLNMYWNFFDSSLLEHFVTRHGSEALKEEMKKYASDLKVFQRRTTVEQLLKVCPCGFRSEKPPPNFSQIFSELDLKASEYTLEMLENLRQKFCNVLSLPTFAFMLASLREGSVIIVWHIPSSEVHRFHNPTIQWNLIFTKLLQLKVDGQLAINFNGQALTKKITVADTDFQQESSLKQLPDSQEQVAAVCTDSSTQPATTKGVQDLSAMATRGGVKEEGKRKKIGGCQPYIVLGLPWGTPSFSVSALSVDFDSVSYYRQLQDLSAMATGRREYPDLENAIVQAVEKVSGRKDLSILNVLDIEKFWSAISIERKLGPSEKSKVPYGEDDVIANATDSTKTFDVSIKSHDATIDLQAAKFVGGDAKVKASSSHSESKKKDVQKPAVKLRPHTQLVIRTFKETQKRRVIVKARSNYVVRFEYKKDAPSGALGTATAVGAVFGSALAGPLGAAAGVFVGYKTAKGLQCETVRGQVTARDIFAVLPKFQERGDFVTCEVQRCKFRYSDKKEYKRIPRQR